MRTKPQPPKEHLLTVPVIFSFTLLEKLETVVLRKGRIPRVVTSGLYSYLIYLPEIGVGLSLDVKSKNLNSRFFRHFIRYTGLRQLIQTEDSKLLVVVPHNYNPQENRIVSWGVFDLVDIPREEYTRFFNVLYEDITMMPSIISTSGIFHPTRWAMFDVRTQKFSFRRKVTINSGIIYVENTESEPITIRDENLHRFKATFVSPLPTGHVWIKEITLHSQNEPEKIFQDAPGYFNSLFLTFNETWNRGRTKEYNILDDSMVTPFEAADVVRELIYHFSEDVRNPLIRARIPKNIIESILRKFSRVGKRFRLENPLFSAIGLEVRNTGSNVEVEALNPTYYILLKELRGEIRKIGDFKMTLTEASKEPATHREILRAFWNNSEVTKAKEEFVEKVYLNVFREW